MRALLTLLALAISLPAHAGPLNDTGITFCGSYPGGNTAAPCTPNPAGQDRQYGRDAAAAAGVLPKVGAGSKGFDFTKIANNGTVLPAGAVLGSGATDWACTYDNTTGLMWEVKTTSGLRSQSHSYTWYDSVHNYGGNAGTASGGTCETAGRCDTEKFVADVNAAGLCGHDDWRMPTKNELYNLADRGIASGPAIDTTYFPNTPASYFWSGSPVAGLSDYAWFVDFDYGFDYWDFRGNALQVRLVRAGQ